jgi:hypothetical protein
MLFRVVIKTNNGLLYYLTDDTESPEVDSFVVSDNIEFLSNCYPTHAQTFSTIEKANEVISSLPYPYNEKAFSVEVLAKDSPIASHIYYRVVKNTLKGNVLWARSDKSFDVAIDPNTVKFFDKEKAQEFIKTLIGWDKRISKVAFILDHGAPDYNFEYEIIDLGRRFLVSSGNQAPVRVK